MNHVSLIAESSVLEMGLSVCLSLSLSVSFSVFLGINCRNCKLSILLALLLTLTAENSYKCNVMAMYTH